MYDYEAATATNLSLMEGETVLVLEKASNGWWNGEASQGTGWFPEAYVGHRSVRAPHAHALHARSLPHPQPPHARSRPRAENRRTCCRWDGRPTPTTLGASTTST